MKCGEITVTLKNVHFIFRLPVLGKPLTCPSLSREIFGNEWAGEWNNVKKRSGISLVWLHQKNFNYPDNASRYVVGMYTKAYVLWLCGGFYFPQGQKILYTLGICILFMIQIRLPRMHGVPHVCHIYIGVCTHL